MRVEVYDRVSRNLGAQELIAGSYVRAVVDRRIQVVVVTRTGALGFNTDRNRAGIAFNTATEGVLGHAAFHVALGGRIVSRPGLDVVTDQIGRASCRERVWQYV